MYIYHYGVKGMKWGVRRTREQLGYDDDIKISKGSKVSHITSEPEKINLDNRPIYATKDPKDARIYGGAYGYYLRGEDAIISQHQLEARQDLKIAGEKAQKETFDNLFNKKHKLLVRAMREDYKVARVAGQIKGDTPYKEFTKDKDRMFSLFKQYSVPLYFTTSTGKMKTINMHLAKRFVDDLVKQDYNGVVDLYDKDNFYGVKTPIAIFNGKKYLEDSDDIRYILDADINSVVKELNRSNKRNRQLDIMHSNIM